VGQDGSIISCTAVNNYFGGILTGNGCCLKDTITLTNGVDDFFDSWGVSTGNGCTIIGCTANGNYGEGIEAGNGCTIKDCTADMNQAGGFFVDADCTVTGCTAWTNNFNGFVLGSECSIINCNACANNGSGIVAGYSCLVKDNTTASNDRYVPNNGGAAGIYASYSGCRIEGNNSNSDYYGIWVNGSENIVINNTVRAALNLNYFIVGGNMTGTVVNVAPETSGIDGSSGGIGMGTTDPFANFSF
jgi:parallel beta-helix repeat protein